MSRFNEMLRELIEDVSKFLLVTLNNEILTTNALSRKESLLMKIQHIRQEYPQLAIGSTPVSRKTSKSSLHIHTDTVVPLGAVSGSPSSPQPYLDMQAMAPLSKEPSPVLSERSFQIEQSDVYEEYDGEGNNLAVANNPDTDSFVDDAKKDIPEISAADLAKCEKNGFLEKKGRERLKGFLSPFHRRWCAIKSGIFYYFDNANDRRPKGHIDLMGYEARAAPQACKDPTKKSLCFEIVCPGRRTYQFIASTAKDMKQWIVAIDRNSKTSNGENVLSALSSVSSEILEPPRSTTTAALMVENPKKHLPLKPEAQLNLDANIITEDIYEVLDEDDKPIENKLKHPTEDEFYIDNEDENNNFKPEEWYVALWDCVSGDEKELSFYRGDMIQIVSKEFDGQAWWTGQLGSRSGFVPKNFLMEAYEKV